MNAAISPDVIANAIPENILDLPGLERVYHHLTFLKVINELEAPKSHNSDFGGYKYRSAEDIQAALKPLLLKYKCIVFTREFEMQDGFKVYAYIVFKDQTYMRCDLPGVATFDFEKDLNSNKKISKTQQFAAYQSYAKKYALSNLLLIDDSQNDLDALTNQNIQNEQQFSNKKNYQNRSNKQMASQADCDRALKQIEELPLNTSLEQAEYIFDGLRQQYPKFDKEIYEAGCAKYNAIMQHLQGLSQQQLTQQTGNATQQQTQNTQQQRNNRAQSPNSPKPGCISNKQRDELQAFINERGLDIKYVCEFIGIDTLAEIQAAKFDQVKIDIDKLAKQELSS
ncbi:ERF family protein [Acinetobacter pittii]|uniref:ERF family protein n=1 Tax=Acinetobacter calcoaceticus/baumannii complex TaxID=909768 RepID=UPI000838E7B1|nr:MULTISPECIES: ERF family protein [Acinetobacter calcoaceticus/baumannii complex]MCK0925223.1 ERF family protein [Acinetobacter pittii]OTK27759.1 single-stranded DNA-binding protein [Acinetobacter baumannii]